MNYTNKITARITRHLQAVIRFNTDRAHRKAGEWIRRIDLADWQEFLDAQDEIIFADGFSGAGGFSIAIEQSGTARVGAAINHDAVAIAAYKSNHQGVMTFNHDIREVDPWLLLPFGCNALIWAAECTHFSLAKGGESRDPDSRMLSEELQRFAEVIKPRTIICENVREFLSWGPLVEKRRKEKMEVAASGPHKGKLVKVPDPNSPQVYKHGKPVMVPDKRYTRLFYDRWVKRISGLGYAYEWRTLNAADYGAHQSRIRYFGVFIRRDCYDRHYWPKPTHDKNGPIAGTLLNPDSREKWKGCGEVLDLHDWGIPLVASQKPLVANTIRRIEYGLNKYKYQALPVAQMVERYQTGARPVPVTEPAPTIKASWNHALLTFVTKYYGGDGKPNQVSSTLDPLGTIPTNDRFGFIGVQFHQKRSWSLKNAFPLDEVLRTMTTRSDEDCLHTALFNPWASFQFVQNRMGDKHGVSSVNDPLCTIVAKRPDLIQHTPFLCHYYGGGQGNSDSRVSSTGEPAKTITTGRTPGLAHAMILPLDDDRPLIFQRADDVLGPWPQWVRVEGIYAVDNRIVDVGYRLLHVHELARCQGFPEDYKLHPTNREQSKKFIGNSVETNCARGLIKSIVGGLLAPSEENKKWGVA